MSQSKGKTILERAKEAVKSAAPKKEEPQADDKKSKRIVDMEIEKKKKESAAEPPCKNPFEPHMWTEVEGSRSCRICGTTQFLGVKK